MKWLWTPSSFVSVSKKNETFILLRTSFNCHSVYVCFQLDKNCEWDVYHSERLYKDYSFWYCPIGTAMHVKKFLKSVWFCLNLISTCIKKREIVTFSMKSVNEKNITMIKWIKINFSFVRTQFIIQFFLPFSVIYSCYKRDLG
jgi:hypothetical protein